MIIHACVFVSLTKPLISEKQKAPFLLVTTLNLQTGCGANFFKNFQNQTAANAYCPIHCTLYDVVTGQKPASMAFLVILVAAKVN